MNPHDGRRLPPRGAQRDALELARKTGMLRRIGSGWLSIESPEGLPVTMRPSAGTTTVRSCISRGWLELTRRDVVTLTAIGTRVLAGSRPKFHRMK